MMEPAERNPAWVEHQRTVRHDMRNQVSHIMNYAELVLEDARDGGFTKLASDLEWVQAMGETALRHIDRYFDASVSSSDNAVSDYRGPDVLNRAELRSLSHEIGERIARASEYAEIQDQASVRSDLGRIGASAGRLLALTEVMFDPTGLAAPRPAEEVVVGMAVEESPRIPSAELSNGTILAVDDDELNRDLLARTLTRLGYQVVCAESGERALEILAREHIDLVLLDIMMPGLDGFQILAQRRSSAALRDIPFLMISGLDDLSAVVRCIEMGAEDYLPKPFDPILLRARVGACLEKKRLRDAEVEYLQQVTVVIAAAAAVETRSDLPSSLLQVSQRTDELGKLARVFQEMVREVYAREDQLRSDLQQLQIQIQIDQTKKARQVAEITESDYFQQLRRRAESMRGGAAPPGPNQPSGQNE